MVNKIKTVGLVRFSVLTPTYYNERFDTLEKTAAHLFSPERMALRFRIFENLCLPSLVKQSDSEFDCVVLTADSMPEKYLERLAGLLDPLPNIHCQTAGTDKHYRLLSFGYNSVPVDDYTHRIQFRLDDDDAVDIDFIKRTKHLAKGLLQVQGPDTPFIIANNRGFYVRSTGDEAEIFDACERLPLSVGTSLVASVNYANNPYRYNHRRLTMHYNTYSDISVPSFIRTIHEDNKSNPSQSGFTHKLKAKDIDAQLARHFGVSRDDLLAL